MSGSFSRELEQCSYKD